MARLVRVVGNFFSWVNSRLQDGIQSQAVEVMQDLAVCAKSGVAVALVFIFLRASLQEYMCHNVNFYYCEGTEENAQVRRGIIPIVSKKLCKPVNNAEGGRNLFLGLAIANMLLFLSAIFLKHSALRMRYPSFKAYLVCALSFLLACLKLGVVVYIGVVMQNRFSCNTQGQYFNRMTVVYTVNELIPSKYNCVDPPDQSNPKSCGSSQVAPELLKECKTSQILDCTKDACSSNLTTETYILSITFVLSFLYIAYLLHEYQEHHIKCSKNDRTPSANAATDLSGDASGEDSAMSSSEGLIEERRPLLVRGNGLVEGAQEGRKSDKSQRLAFRILRDLSTLTKYLLVIITLKLTVFSIQGELVNCSEITKTMWSFLDEKIDSDMVQSNCNPQVLKNTNQFVFLFSFTLFIISFIPAVVLEKKPRFIPNSSKVALCMLFVATVAFIGQILALLSLLTLPVAFKNNGQKATYKTNNVTVTVTSNYLSEQIIYASMVGYKGHPNSSVKCSTLCTTEFKLPTALMLVTIALTYLYLVYLIIGYYAAAKRKPKEN